MDNGPEDRRFIEQAASGDRRAFGELVTRYQRRLFRFVFMLLKSKDGADDIVQDAFVNAWQALATFESDKPFYPWLSTIARNLALNRLKREARQTQASEMEDEFEKIPDRALNPLDKLIEKENDRVLARAVMSLPEQYRTVFVLRMIEKMPYEKIAEQLNISPGTVDSRLHRARAKLMEMLKEHL